MYSVHVDSLTGISSSHFDSYHIQIKHLFFRSFLGALRGPQAAVQAHPEQNNTRGCNEAKRELKHAVFLGVLF